MRLLSVADRNDPLTENIARAVIDIGAGTINDPAEIAQIAIRRLGIKAPQ